MKICTIAGAAAEIHAADPSSTKPKQFRIGHIACHIHGTFDYLNYPYYPAYTG